jgi:hypothetical protein
MDVLQRALAQRDKALQIARENLEGPETRELKKQLSSVLQQKQKAGDQAGMDMVLSRLCSGLPTHLGSLSFEGQGTFAT